VSCYIHHVPGRLRVKSVMFRKNEAIVSAVKDLLEQIDGVKTVEINVKTGSVIVHYDSKRIKHSYILSLFVANEYIDLFAPVESNGSSNGVKGAGRELAASVADNLSKAIVEFLFEKLLQRAAITLAGALA
jgi:copper chaperone CopZ